MRPKGRPFELGFIHPFFCNSCCRNTNHKLVYKHEISDFVDGQSPEKQTAPVGHIQTRIDRLWMCCGCETHKYEIATSKPGMNEDIYDCIFYPDFAENCHPNRNYQFVDPIIAQLYTEAVKAFNTQLYLSCALMLRTLLESLCKINGISDKSAWGLKDKLRKLAEKLHINSPVFQAISALKFMGDKAAHLQKSSSLDELRLGIQLTECLFDYLYESPERLKTKAELLVQIKTFRDQLPQLAKRNHDRRKS